jgi:hypothetical protein
MLRSVPLAALVLGLAVCVVAPDAGRLAAQKPRPNAAWERMDYGPFLTATVTANLPPKNTANKGIAIKLSKEPMAAVCFDTDLLRYSAGWIGDFLNLRGTPFDGGHGNHPTIKGDQIFGTAVMAGWARPGKEEIEPDPRKEPYGPLPRDWCRFKGLHLHGDKVVLSYTVGDCDVLEMPEFLVKDGVPVFVRNVNIGPTKQRQMMLLSHEPKKDVPPRVAAVQSGNQRMTLLWLPGQGGYTAVHVDPSDKPQSFRAFVYNGPRSADLERSLEKLPDAPDLASLTKGGPTRWTQPVETKGSLGAGTGPYVVDTITTPEQNPYNSWMRFGGFDFFSDGRAALCTWSGDVWVVSGIDDKLDKLTWKRYATGLFQPLGLKIVDDKVYTLGREGIVRLHDLNGDGEADFYEAFNNEVHTTPGFHEFAFDLQTDAEGNFYFAKGGPVRGGGRGFEYIAAHSGCVLKVSKDGSKMEVFATGLRAPNGIGVGPNGIVTTGDNEGTWLPKCRLNWFKKDGFGGCVDTAHRTPAPTWYDDPLCWFPKNVDNSGGGQCWVTSDKWGPVQGYPLHTAYGTSSLWLVLKDPGEHLQGGVVRVPVNFLSGTMRPRFNPRDGQLYVCGLKGWQTNAARDGAFQRVRYTGKPLNSVVGLKVVKGGLELTFSDRLDPQTVNADAFAIQQWNYLWCSEYGSDDYKTTDPDFEKKVREYNRLREDRGKNAAAIAALAKEFVKGKDTMTVKAATLSTDGKTVKLEIADVRRVMQMHIRYRLKGADGTAINQEVYNTINATPR